MCYLEKAAEKLKLKVAVIDQLIREAIKEKVTKAKEIIKLIRQKLVELATNFKCSDILHEAVCAKIKEIAAKMKVKAAEVDRFLKEIIAKGVTKIKEIIHELIEHLFPHLEIGDFVDVSAVSKCEDVLSAKVCADLRAIAEKLKLKAKIIDQLIREAIAKKITKAKEIIKLVRQKLVDLATNFKCTDVLSEKVCAKIKEIAAKVQVKAAEIDKIIKEIVAKGITKAKEIIHAIIDHFFPHLEYTDNLEAVNLSCEDVISEAACNALRRIAKTLKLKAEIIDKIIREAIAQKITSAKAIVDMVRKKLVELAKNFKCTDVLSEKICAKIHEIAEKIKVKFHEIEEFMKEAIARGITKIKEIIQKIIDHFFPHLEMEELVELSTMTCEDVLSAKVCADLREAAKKLKLKIEIIDQIIREAIEKKITKAKEIIKMIRQRIIELATNFKCTDVLSEKVCERLHEIAEKLKVKVAAIDEFLKELVAKGITKIKEIIEKIKQHFFPSQYEITDILDGENMRCEDIISEMACQILRKIAKTLKLKADIIDKIIREAIAKKIKSAKAIVDYVRKKLVDLAKNFKCTDVLSEKVCSKIKEIADKVKVKFTQVVEFIKEVIAKGITKIKEIIDAIKKHFFPHNEIAELMDENTMTCEDVLSAKVCAELRAAAEKLKVKVGVIDKIIREAIQKKITKAKEIIALVRQKIVDMAKNFKCTDVLTEEVCTKIHEIAEKLKIKIAEVDKVLKEIIAKGITKIKEIIEKIKEHFFPHFENVDFFISTKFE